jgi:adenylate kinase family enzyme
MPHRIVIIGTSGVGKSTIARTLSATHYLPHVELDALYWAPGWTPVPADVFRARVDAATAGDAWVSCGNYSVVRDLLWSRADTFVWLDYSLPRTLWRVVCRTIHRRRTRELLWNTNRESLRKQLFTRDSLFWWVLTTFFKRRREFPPLLAAQSAAGKTALRFRRPRDTAAWLRSLTPAR